MRLKKSMCQSPGYGKTQLNEPPYCDFNFIVCDMVLYDMTENVEKKLKTQHRKGMTRVIIVNMYFVLNSIY